MTNPERGYGSGWRLSVRDSPIRNSDSTTRDGASPSPAVPRPTRVRESPVVLDRPPVVLSFLAPAVRCNQACPRCVLTEVTREPVRSFGLEPEDYARFVRQLLAGELPILSIDFQGYEVTLPRSWPYLEAVFRVANAARIPTGFVTNGMLLHKRASSIEALGPDRISISIDGSSAAVNDHHRGLPGAFEATLSSLRRFLDRLPSFAERLAIISCLYDEANASSLLRMPALLKDLGVTRWALSFAVRADGNRVVPAQNEETLMRWMLPLQREANAVGVSCFVNDEFGTTFTQASSDLRVETIGDPRLIYRMDPTGSVRQGLEIARIWDQERVRRWNPGTDNAVESIDYWSTVAELVT